MTLTQFSRFTTRALASALIFMAIPVALTSCQPKPVAAPVPTEAEITAESKRLFDWFELKFEAFIARNPMAATYLGRRDRYGEWDDASDAGLDAELEIQRAMIAEMKSTFNFDALDTQGKLSWRLAENNLKRAEGDRPFRLHDYVFDQMYGAQAEIPAFLINQHEIKSKADAESYISRVRGVPAYLGTLTARSKAASAAGILAPRFVYGYVLSDAEGVVTGAPFKGAGESPLYEDFRTKVDALLAAGTIDANQHNGLLRDVRDALVQALGPAYDAAIVEIKAQAAKTNDDDGVWKLPDGEAFYRQQLYKSTTTDMSAAEIHSLGLKEVARIQDEMRVIMQQTGFKGDLKQFFEYMRTDARFYKPNSPEGRQAYLDQATAAIEQMRGDLPKVFKTFPKAGMIVKAVEPFREKSAGKAFYSQPSADGLRPGVYYANLYRMQDMPLYQLEALAFHEGIPGHHMQIAIAQELTGIPQFRKYGDYTAFSEGWGLYSEYLPKEMGYYKDPYADFGRLAMEIWRAARLVVDTGIHDKKWTRGEAVQYLLDNTPNPEGDCRKAIDRYIVMPGQATAYKIGMIKILELRELSRAELGPAFDIRDFHDVVLKDGAVPLDVLEENVKAWIASKKEATK